MSQHSLWGAWKDVYKTEVRASVSAMYIHPMCIFSELLQPILSGMSVEDVLPYSIFMILKREITVLIFAIHTTYSSMVSWYKIIFMYLWAQLPDEIVLSSDCGRYHFNIVFLIHVLYDIFSPMKSIDSSKRNTFATICTCFAMIS